MNRRKTTERMCGESLNRNEPYVGDIRSGLTLVEVLIGLTMTLIVLGAMMVAFRFASEQISRGRAMMELSNQLRSVQNEIRADFAGLTIDVHLGDRNATPNGYFEYVEGPVKDNSFQSNITNAYGDYDDILAMTARTSGRPFRGRFVVSGNVTTIESNIAEIVWWHSFEDINGNGNLDESEFITIRLHRRNLLIRPNLTSIPAPDDDSVRRFFLMNDVSMRWDRSDANSANWRLIPNSLTDLSRRENRFGRGFGLSLSYPHHINRGMLQQVELSQTNLSILGDPSAFQYVGQDIVLNNLLSFDVKVFSPNATIQGSPTIGIPMDPHSPTYGDITNSILGLGAFVDLGFLGFVGNDFDPLQLNTQAQFSTLPMPKFPLLDTDIPYCTFSPHYENDGLDQNGLFSADEGTNGLDDDGINGVDDDGERETAPPYPFMTRGVQVRIRLLEPNTKQVRETVVTESLLPK